MGRASNKKKAKRQRPDLVIKVREHIEFLEQSSVSFDRGFDAESKRMATSIRVLLHDTNQSASLLGQIDVKKKMRYKDTAGEIIPGNYFPDFPLISMEIGGGQNRYRAHLSGSPRDNAPPLDFLKWWNRPVMRKENKSWSRWELVRELVNKEGGAHVDPHLNSDYLALVAGHKLGFTVTNLDASGNPIGDRRSLEGDPVGESVRQITYELLETLYEHEYLLE